MPVMPLVRRTYPASQGCKRPRFTPAARRGSGVPSRMRRAFGLAAADGPGPGERSALGRDDRALPLAGAVVIIEDDPVAHLAHFVRASGVGEERGVVAVASVGVEDRQPGFARRVEAARRNPPQAAP